MNRRVFLTSLTAPALIRAQQTPDIPFVCPMDPDVRSGTPSKCPRCGMALVAGIPEPREFQVELSLKPRVPKPESPVQMRFAMQDPRTGKPAKLQIIHEKLFHLFLVKDDLSFFAHEHPELQVDGTFLLDTAFPVAGEYRVLCDFYPENATPQLIPKTVIVPGQRSHSELKPDLTPKEGVNVRVSLKMEPAGPLAGKKTMLFFSLDPTEGLEQYLGAWGHMLVASSDLVDVIHSHPAWEDRNPEVQFNIIFPRPGLHRVWVQFQRLGVVNTVAFNIPVDKL